jgi:acetyltransferase-like isoleucine patch superfamily enzyme
LSRPTSRDRGDGSKHLRIETAITHPSALILEGVVVGGETVIGPFCVIGGRYRRVAGKLLKARRETRIGRECQLGAHVRILRGTRIGDRTSIDGGCTVEQNVDIGKACFLTYHAFVCNSAKIGDECVVGGFVGERSRIGDHSRIFGQLVHRQENPSAGWDDADEPAPTLDHHAFVAFGAVVAGGVQIGKRSFVCAGAVVTKDVAPRHIVTGRDDAVFYRGSKMRRLARSRWFSEEDDD